MFLFTGDMHGEVGRFYELSQKYPNLGPDDYIIICGDFGFLFRNDRRENLWLDDLSNVPYNICFVDGNHENFSALNSFPIEYWNSGKVHRIRRNIFHLMRGQVFEIAGKNIFTMGGAYSIDRYARRLNESYWVEELPVDEEYKEAAFNLKRACYKVDYIVTHTCPLKQILRMGFNPDLHDAELTGFLEWVMYETEFSDWFYGHWHTDVDYGKMHALFIRTIVIS